MPNPQAMAAVSRVTLYGGAPELGTQVDPDTWLTPRYVLNELGAFDLDPCAADAQPTWVADRFMVKADDGLNSEWSGRVFMNPPFSNTGPWLHKHSHHRKGISLVPASVESVVWRKVVWKLADCILLAHGRTRFCNPDGSTTTGRPLRSIALIAWSPEDGAVLKRCQLAGVLLRGWEQR